MTSNNMDKSQTLSRSVAAVSSGSSLDSFSRNVPQHSRESQISNSSVEDMKQGSPCIQTVRSIAEVKESYGKVTENQPTQTYKPIIPGKPESRLTQPLPNVPSTSQPSSLIPNTGNNAPVNNTVAEFLYQLTKMLTDDNRDVIEWSNSRIEVHNPHRLANEVLHKYFRHSKFASFQRQLNYFGFRKLAGKGKMAPCSYVNDATTSELRSILLIKRKTTPVTARDKTLKRRDRSEIMDDSSTQALPPVNPVLAGILYRSTSSDPEGKKLSSGVLTSTLSGKGIKHALNGYLKPSTNISAPTNINEHLAIARSVVGKGIRHGYSKVSNNAVATVTSSLGSIPSSQSTAAAVTSPLGLIPSSQSTAAAVTTSSLGSIPSSQSTVAVASVAAVASATTAPLQLPKPTTDTSRSMATCDFTFQEPYQLGMDIQSSLSELSTNFKNSIKGENAETPVLGFLSRDSSLVDLAMLDPLEPTPVSEMKNEMCGTYDPSFFPFIDFPNPSQDYESSPEC